MSTAKSFASSEEYEREIRSVLPGYDALRQVAEDAVVTAAPYRVLVMGCGPGGELTRLAARLPHASFDAYDTSAAMVASARQQTRHDARFSVHHGPVPAHDSPPFDVATALLVMHFLPDDGARADAWRALASAVKPGCLLVTSEIEPVSDDQLDLWLAHARRHGLSPARCAVLAQRLTQGFACLPAERTARLARAAGFTAQAHLARVFSTSVRVWRRAPDKASRP